MDFSCSSLVQCLRVTSLSLAFKIQELRAAEAQLYVCALEVLVDTVLDSGSKRHLKLV